MPFPTCLRGVLAAACLAISVALPSAANAQSSAAPAVLSLPTVPPKGAVVLFSGKESELATLWQKRYTTNPPGWKVENGVAVPADKTDIRTTREFGDFLLHIEFRTPTQGGGNSGVGLQGRYEVQIFNTFGKEPDTHNGAAFYSQKAAKVNASGQPGAWQSYDILFRAPRFNEKGEVVEKPRATVLWNGVVVQNNEEFVGMTGIQYGEYKEMKPTGPIVLQGDHDPVQFRNIWVVPM
ncbi:MAG: DUF1080 domain-containing protein [Capsulimonadales bacterium]|nr:DUF1080 domain-containing protein [Capsulimonadales bacterium]